jgi:hypothetical protein
VHWLDSEPQPEKVLVEEQHHPVPERWRHIRLEGLATSPSTVAIAFPCATTSANTTTAATTTNTNTNTTDTYINAVEELVLRKCGHGCAV